MNMRPHFAALRKEARRLPPQGNARNVVIDRITHLEGWLEELGRLDVEEARTIRRHTSRLDHYGGCNNQPEAKGCADDQ
ncbi:protein of unknown function [Methylorubrum extorquens]|uniref:Uncharacterized protein n=1 Tax=Methylorubrum extorquens TaxID=408 RepID=A0A2N9AJQ6_METEX|nr:protein of unknown function [Methylorubrum extorquens]